MISPNRLPELLAKLQEIAQRPPEGRHYAMSLFYETVPVMRAVRNIDNRRRRSVWMQLAVAQ